MSNSRITIRLELTGKEKLDEVIAKLAKEYKLHAEADFSDIESSLNEQISALDNFKVRAKEFGLVMNGVSSAIGMVLKVYEATVGKFVSTAAEFEQLELRLQSLYQDTDKAAAAFEKFREVAADTPATLKGVVEAGATLKAFGLDAENVLGSVSDLAAYMGMDITEAAQAMGRAFAGGVGAADVLRERGVLNLVKSFKGIDDLTKLTLPEFREAMLSTFTDSAAGIAGSADRMSESYTGAVANMQDAMEMLQQAIGKELIPVLTDAARELTGVVEKFSQFTEVVGGLSGAQKALAGGIILMNAAIAANIAVMIKQRAAWMALSVQERVNMINILSYIAAQKAATASSLTFSGALKAVTASLARAGVAAKAFLVSLGPVAWAAVAVTAGLGAWALASKKNVEGQQELVSSQKELLEQENAQLQKSKDLATETVTLAERYDELARKTKLNKAEQAELKKIHDVLQNRYPNIISSTGSYASKLGDVKSAAKAAREEIASLSKQMWDNALEEKRLSIQGKQLDAFDALSQNINWADNFSFDTTSGRASAISAVSGIMNSLAGKTLKDSSTDKIIENLEYYAKPTSGLNDKERASIIRAIAHLKAQKSLRQELATMKAEGPPQEVASSSGGGSGGSGGSGGTKTSQEPEWKKRLEEYQAWKKAAFDEQKKREQELDEMFDKEIQKAQGSNKEELQEAKDWELGKIREEYREKEAAAEKQHYEELKFYDSDYYEWKLAYLEAESRKLFASDEAAREKWLAAQTETLNAEKKAFDNSYLERFESEYEDEMSHLAELRELGLATYDEIAAASWKYYNNLKAIFEGDGELTESEKELLNIYLKRAQAAQLAVNRDSDKAKYYNEVKFLDSSYYEWKKARIEEDVRLMKISEEQKAIILKASLAALDQEMENFKPGKSIFGRLLDAFDIPEEQQTKIKSTFQTLSNQISSIWSQMYNNIASAKDHALKEVEERAKKERKTDVWLAKEKEKIEEEYAKKQKQMKKIEQRMQISSALANTAEGVTNALTVKPAWLSIATAAAVGALGLAQVKVIAEQKFSGGGQFRGKGTTTSDSNIIAVSDQEYIVSAERVARFGVPFFDALNFGSGEQIRKALAGIKIPNAATVYPQKAQGYATGGVVSPQAPVAAQNVSMNVILKCDGKALAKAVIKGKKKIIST